MAQYMQEDIRNLWTEESRCRLLVETARQSLSLSLSSALNPCPYSEAMPQPISNRCYIIDIHMSQVVLGQNKITSTSTRLTSWLALVGTTKTHPMSILCKPVLMVQTCWSKGSLEKLMRQPNWWKKRWDLKTRPQQAVQWVAVMLSRLGDLGQCRVWSWSSNGNTLCWIPWPYQRISRCRRASVWVDCHWSSPVPLTDLKAIQLTLSNLQSCILLEAQNPAEFGVGHYLWIPLGQLASVILQNSEPGRHLCCYTPSKQNCSEQRQSCQSRCPCTKHHAPGCW